MKTRKEVHKFADNLCDQIRRNNEKLDDDGEITVAKSMVAAEALGTFTGKMFRDNAVIVFVAGHENPQLFLTSLLYVCAKYPDVQEKLRQEAKSNIAMDKRSYLASVIYEVLRMYPPISQLVNRKTSARIVVGEKLVIPKNTYVGYICYGTGRDPQIWGPDADKFIPERWGSSIEEIRAKYLSAKSSCKLITFHGGPRACLGERLALAETKILLTEMLNSVTWILDPE